jgi:hypothetical protein
MPDLPSANVDAFNNDLITAGTTYYFNFATGDPGGTGANEDTSLTRQPVTFGSSSGGTQTSSLAMSFTSVPGGTTYTHFVIFTAASGGTYVRGGILGTYASPAPITPGTGATINIAAGGVTCVA